MTPESLSRLKLLNEKRTPGPWQAVPGWFTSGYEFAAPNELIAAGPITIKPANAEFIATLANHASELLEGYERAAKLLATAKEAMEMGAFHHSSCGANEYDDNSVRGDYIGIGDHRESKPCTCAHYKIDLALSAIDGKDGEK